MKKNVLLLLSFSWLLMAACTKSVALQEDDTTISEAVLAKIHQLGFDTKNVQKIPEGYLVEDDIILDEEYMSGNPDRLMLRIGEEEQYHTTNLVTKLPRTISVSLDNSLPESIYGDVLDAMIARYNAENLEIKFQRGNRKSDITFRAAPFTAGYLASAGFPDRRGNPYKQIQVNRGYLDNAAFNTNVSIFAHEVGHCIGFRHTDYMNRSYSCGGSAYNEGDGGVGAIYIPGTNTGPDPNSWMLSCIGNGDNRPFNPNDKTALDYLY